MPKQNKTRKQKIQSDKRRQSLPSLAKPREEQQISNEATSESISEQILSGTFSLPNGYIPKVKAKTTEKNTFQAASHTAAISTRSYTYLRGDLLKTAIITSIIIAAEILIYFFIIK